MLIETVSTALQKAFATNSTSASFTDPPDRLTPPSGDGVWGAGIGGGLSQNCLLIEPYALGSDGDTFSIRIVGWNQINGPKGQWTALTLAELACTLGSKTGVAGGDVVATELYADTMTLVGSTANAGIDIDIVSPANNTKAFAKVDTSGHQMLQFLFDSTGSATSMNCLFRQF